MDTKKKAPAVRELTDKELDQVVGGVMKSPIISSFGSAGSAMDQKLMKMGFRPRKV